MGRPLPIVEGRRFGCVSGCGNCCALPGKVFFQEGELERITDHLGVDAEAFRAENNVTPGEGAHAWVLDAEARGSCPFLSDAQRCSIQSVKPRQCRTFPFWDALLEDETLWEASKSYCPGIDHEQARLYDEDEIESIRSGLHGTD